MSLPSKGVAHRSTVTGRRGMVACAHPLAALAGMRMLMEGGNAIDAAVATAAALNVAEPFMSGIGGVGYMHIYSAAKREQKILDYVGLTPAATDLTRYATEESTSEGPLSPLVPGACGGWLEALRRYGSMDVSTVFEPAIEYAETGIALTVFGSSIFKQSAEVLNKFPASAGNYLIGGRAPHPGEALVQSDLARSFRAVAEGGEEVFYRGDIAKRMVEFLRQSGGLITEQDLAGFEAVWLDPISTDYRGYKVCTPPLPCQAIQFLETLNIMEGFDVGAMGHNSPQTLHHFIEAVKLATADRAEYAAIENPPAGGLLSKKFAGERRQLIQSKARPTGGERYTATKMAGEVVAGDPQRWLESECTTHFDAIDADGNAVAVTQSLGSAFGSGMVVPGTGIALNNFMNWFDLEPTSPNVIGPSKKNEMCMSPVQIWKDGDLQMLIGTPGSYGILQTTPQMIMNVLDHDLHIQAAIEAPRLKATNPGYVVHAESRIGRSVFDELEGRGHHIEDIGDWSVLVGGGQGIIVDHESNSFMGGADPRRDGYVLGW
jgi:gamma-glutamyltranspeptidase/glutathione hydrolase